MQPGQARSRRLGPHSFSSTPDRSQHSFQFALRDSQGVVPGPTAAASPGNLDEMHSQASPQASSFRNPGVGHSRVCFNKPSRAKFEKHGLRKTLYKLGLMLFCG